MPDEVPDDRASDGGGGGDEPRAHITPRSSVAYPSPTTPTAASYPHSPPQSAAMSVAMSASYPTPQPYMFGTYSYTHAPLAGPSSSPTAALGSSPLNPARTRGPARPSPHASPRAVARELTDAVTAAAAAAVAAALPMRRASLATSALHEIQPPRRLSTHQVLLLTPFGQPVPLEPRGSVGSSSMAREPSAMSRDSPAGGSRPGSLVPAAARRSPRSQPLATINSGSTLADDESDDETHMIVPSTVPMTRSNSVPVLSLAEVELLRARDAELGISRGQEFAWVSRVGSVHDDSASPTLETPQLIDDSASTLSTDAAPTVAPSPTPSFTRFPGAPAFSNPFAPAEVVPAATSPGYHYAALPDEGRRASDAPRPPRHMAAAPAAGRRPSAPVVRADQVAKALLLAHDESPRGTAALPLADAPLAAPAPAPVRPALKRYRTSPARFHGLGLDVVVRDADAAAAGPSAPAGPGSWARVVPADRHAHPSARPPSAAGSGGSAGSSTASPLSIEVAARALGLGDDPAGPAPRARYESVDSSIPFFPSGLAKFVAQRISDPSPAARRESHSGVFAAVTRRASEARRRREM